MKQTERVVSSIRKSCTQCTLSIGMPRFNRKDRMVTNEINSAKKATSDAGSYSKNLINTKIGPYAELNELVSEARRFHEDNTSPTKVRGIRLLSAKNYMDYVQGIRERKERFEKLRNQFLSKYEGYIKEAQHSRLGDMFDSSDYPPPSLLEDRFLFDTTCTPLPDSDKIEVFVSGDELEKIRTQIEIDMMEDVNNNQKLLWEKMYASINKMADKCKIPHGEKGAGFKDKDGHGLVSDLTALCSLIPKKDILGDADLDSIRKEVEEKLLIKDPASLREDVTVRNEVADNASAILSTMAGYMGYTPETKTDKKDRLDQVQESWSSSLRLGNETPDKPIEVDTNNRLDAVIAKLNAVI